MQRATLLVATENDVFVVDAAAGTMARSKGLEDRSSSALAADPRVAGRAWCGCDEAGGVYRTDDGGASWHPSGLQDQSVTAIAASPTEPDVVWAGTEPSQVWRSADGGKTWQRTRDLQELPSSATWSFPPRPETHHVRWIACHPRREGQLFVAIEAGALISTKDGGQTWSDRVPAGPYDTHELAIHPDAPDLLRSAAGDGYFESVDGGLTWTKPRRGLEVGYFRSVAIDPGAPDVVLASAASSPFAAYRAGASDGRLYRRAGDGPWERVSDGWPDPPSTIAPLLLAGHKAGELWAADERGVHQSADGGISWQVVASYPATPRHLWALAQLKIG